MRLVPLDTPASTSYIYDSLITVDNCDELQEFFLTQLHFNLVNTGGNISHTSLFCYHRNSHNFVNTGRSVLDWLH